MAEPPHHNWAVECDYAKNVVPVLIHTRQQRLIDQMRLAWPNATSLPSVAIRMTGLVNRTWPLTTTTLKRQTGLVVFEAPQNPCVTFSPDQIDSSVPTTTVLEILVEGQRVWSGDVFLQPPRAVPTDVKYAAAFAAFIIPQAQEVLELTRRARENISGTDIRLGFPNMSAVRAAQFIYLQVARSREPSYAWEPGPCSPLNATQLVRLPRQIFREGQATCLDLALLLCSAFEHIRRLPILLALKMSEGVWHVIPGVKVHDEMEAAVVPLINDITVIRQTCEAHSIYLFDPDGLIQGSDPRDADALARARLSTAEEGFLLDIQAARNSGIWPLAVADPPLRSPVHRPSAGIWLPVEYQGTIPTELLRDLASEKIIILTGDTLDPHAGTSRQVFTRALSRAAGLKDEENLFRACTRIEKEKGRDTLVQMALEALSAQGSDAPPAYSVLTRLPVNTVISFYPDPLLEQVLCMQRPPFRALLDDDDLADLPLGYSSRELYLLGGSALTGKGLILTYDDQDRLLSRIKLLARGLRARIASGTLLVLGCDLNESNFKELYLESTRHLKRPRPIYLSGSRAPQRSTFRLNLVGVRPPELLDTLQRIMPQQQTPTTSSAHTHKRRRPYKYLDYFEPEDYDLFFGRDEDTRHLAAEVMAARNRITVLCGRSGVGKTSLVKAALITYLERAHQMRALYTRCGSNPEAAIISALSGSLATGHTLTDMKSALATTVTAIQSECIVVLDQTEEAIIKLGIPRLHHFFAHVASILSDSDLAVRFLFVIREDYLGRLAVFQSDVQNLLSSVFLLKGLTREGAHNAIVRPAVSCGLTIEPEVADEILDDLSPDLIVPAHLQIVCDQLYEHCQDSGAITLGQYTHLGRASAILNNHLEKAMRQLPHDVEQVARKVLRALVTSEITKDQLSLAQVVGRAALQREKAELVLHELIHVHRLVRELPGDPLRYELSHESLASSVAGWLDAEEAKTRVVQEILEQEMRNVQTIESYRVPRDRMRLIQEYHEQLHLEAEAVSAICSELYLGYDMHDFWRAHLHALKPEYVYEALWRVLRQSNEAAAYLLREESGRLFHPPSQRPTVRRLKKRKGGGPLFTALPPVEFPTDGAEALAEVISTGSDDIAVAGIRLALLDTTRMCEECLLRQLITVPDDQAERIVRQWLDEVLRAGPPPPSRHCQTVTRAQLLALLLEPSDAVDEIRQACSAPAVSVLCSATLWKTIGDKELFHNERRDKVAEALGCIALGENALDELAYMYLVDSLVASPRTGEKLESLFFRLVNRYGAAPLTQLSHAELNVFLRVLIRCLSRLHDFKLVGIARCIHLFDWLQKLSPSLSADEPALVEETVYEVVRMACLDESRVAEELIIARLADMEDEQVTQVTLAWVAFLPYDYSPPSYHESQTLCLAHLLARIVRPEMLGQVLKTLSTTASYRVLAHQLVAEALDSQAGWEEGQREELARSVAALPAAQSPVEELARLWLLSRLDCSNRVARLMGKAAIKVLETPELLQTLSYNEYTAVLQTIAGSLRKARTWANLPTNRVAQFKVALQVERPDLSAQQAQMIGSLLVLDADPQLVVGFMRSANPDVRLGVLDHLATLTPADASIISELERQLHHKGSLSYRMALARVLCRWGRSSGLKTAFSVLKQDYVSDKLRLSCAECFREAPPHVRRESMEALLVSKMSKGKLAEALLLMSDIKWLFDDDYVLNWLLSLKLKDTQMTRLRELLARLMPGLSHRISSLATSSSNPRFRYMMNLVLQDHARSTHHEEK